MTLIQEYAANQDPSIFNALVKRHGDMVYGVCMRITHNTADAEEACQDAFAELAKVSGSIRGSVSCWLYTVARRYAMRAVERRKRYKGQKEQYVDDEHRYETADLIAQVDKALDNLPEKQRAVLVLYYFEEMKQEEIAKELNVSQTTIHKQLKNGLGALRKSLATLGCVVTALSLPEVLQASSAYVLPKSTAISLMKIALSGMTPKVVAVGLLSKILIVVCTVGGVLASTLFLGQEQQSTTLSEPKEVSFLSTEVDKESRYDEALSKIDVAALELTAMTIRTPSYHCRLRYVSPHRIKATGFKQGLSIVNNSSGSVRSLHDLELDIEGVELVDLHSNGVCSLRSQPFTQDDRLVARCHIDWKPLLHYFRQLPLRYSAGEQWKINKTRRGSGWDAHILLAATKRFSDPDMAWEGLRRSKEAGYPIDSYYSLLAISVALQRNDMNAAYHWIEQAQRLLRQSQERNTAIYDLIKRVDLASGLSALLTEEEQQNTAFRSEQWNAYRTNLKSNISIAEILQRSSAVKKIISKDSESRLLSNLRSLGFSYIWGGYDGNVWEVLDKKRDFDAYDLWLHKDNSIGMKIGVMEDIDWEISFRVCINLTNCLWHRDGTFGLSLVDQDSRENYASIDIGNHGNIIVSEKEHSTYISDSGLSYEGRELIAVKMIKIGNKLDIMMNDACIATVYGSDIAKKNLLIFRRSQWIGKALMDGSFMVTIIDFEYNHLDKEREASPVTLLTAIQNDDKTLVQNILEKEGDLKDMFFNNGENLLHYAVSSDKAEALDALLEDGRLPIDFTNSQKMTPLHSAAFFRAKDSCKTLLSSGANILAVNKWEWMPLQYAVHAQDIDLVETFLRHGQAKEQTNYEKSPIFNCIHQSPPRIILDRLLLAKYGIPQPQRSELSGGSRLKIMKQLPLAPRLFALLLHDNTTAFAQLCSATEPDVLKEILDNPGFLPVGFLYVAISYDNASAVEALLNTGVVDVNTVLPGQLLTPILCAVVRTMNPNIIDALIEAGANPRIKTRWRSDSMQASKDWGLDWALQSLKAVSKNFPENLPKKAAEPVVEESVESF